MKMIVLCLWSTLGIPYASIQHSLRVSIWIGLSYSLPRIYKVLCRINILGPVWFLLSRTIFCSWKQKTQKNLFGKGGVFLFFVFSVFLKTIFLRTIKKCFHCSNNRLFFVFSLPSFYVFLDVFCIFSKVSSTQPPHTHLKPFLLP